MLSEAAMADKAELAKLWRAVEAELRAQESTLPGAVAFPKCAHPDGSGVDSLCCAGLYSSIAGAAPALPGLPSR